MTVEQIISQLKESGMPFLLIGGQALQHYLPERETRDIDLAVNRNDLDAWKEFLFSQGFKVQGLHENFWRFHASSSPELDMLLVEPETFSRMHTEAERELIPRIEHLLALKIFALREDPGLRGLRDLKDVVALMRSKKAREEKAK